MATNILKTTEIYGSLSVKDRYATYSNIGVASGAVVSSAYFENSGDSSFNNVKISGSFNTTGTLGIGRDANTNFLTIGCTSNTLHSNAPDGGLYHGLSMVSTKLNPATSLFGNYSLSMGIDNTTGYSYINCAGSGATQPLCLNSRSGCVGIGTISPNTAKTLDVAGDVNISGTLTCADISNTYLKIANYTSNSSNFTGNITLTSGADTASGVYLGKTTNFIYGYNNNLGIRCEGDFYFENSTNSSIMNLNGSTATLTVYNMKVNSKLGILTSTPTEALDVNGNIKCTYLKTSSDYRLKQNVQPLNGEYDISKLKPVSYQMMGKKATGFIAHELQEVFPHLVTGKKDGYEMQSVDYISMISILTYNFQNLKKEVDELKSKLNI